MLPRRLAVLALVSSPCISSLLGLPPRSPRPEIPPPWAYGFAKCLALAVAPPAAPAAKIAPAPADPTRYGLPGTDLKFTRAEITAIFAPADFYPGDHPTPPAIVAHGKEPIVWACARCHYANGKGRPENAGIAGLPVDYFIEQLQAFRAGERVTSDHRKPNTKMMVDYAKAMTDDEIRAAAEYYGAMKWTPWIHVVETGARPADDEGVLGRHVPAGAPPGGDEPLGPAHCRGARGSRRGRKLCAARASVSSPTPRSAA